MAGPGRYLRLYLAFARFGLASEMAFRVNFLVKLLVEVLWLAILIVFYELIFARTDTVAGWDRTDGLGATPRTRELLDQLLAGE